MRNLGYLVAAYALTGAAIGAYLVSLGRRRRSLARRLEQFGGRTHDRTAHGAARD
jgi:CcmD family protein